MRVKFLLTVILLGLIVPSHGQTLRGLVADALTGKPLSPVVVLNVRTGSSVYTEDDGRFSLLAQPGDKIALSFIGYKTMQWTMPVGMGVVTQRIEMEPLSYMLDEAVIRIKNYTPYQLDSIERRSTYQRPLAREKSGSVMSPVTLLAEKLSGNSKRIYRFQKEFNYWENQRFIDSRYTPDMVHMLTGLEGDSLAAFMNQHPMPYDYARYATDLELKMWIRNNYKSYLRRQSLKDSLSNQQPPVAE